MDPCGSVGKGGKGSGSTMKTPRFFLGAVLIFWGWQTGLIWVGLGFAAVLESARWIKTRFDLQPSDFNKFVDISTVLLGGTIVVALSVEARKNSYVLLEWLPMICFPIIAAQEFSIQGRIAVRAFFLTARKKAAHRFDDSRNIDVSYIYGFFCLMSAACANVKTHLFFGVSVLFLAWALWPLRSRRTKPLIWVVCLMGVAVLGFYTQDRIHQAGRRVSRWVMAYYMNYYRANPFRTYTALGDVGHLKFSDHILFRVSFDKERPEAPFLLHTTTYNRFAGSNWYASYDFEPVAPDRDLTFWQVNPPMAATRKMTLYFRLMNGKAVLPLPPGVIDISEMKVGECEKNAMQVIRVQEGPALIKALISFAGSYLHDALPGKDDLQIPSRELSTVAHLADQLGLARQSPEDILNTLRRYFLSGFSYSLDLEGKGRHDTPLQNFLLTTRSGHCEFFATATVLLLRRAGLPARYATGFAVHEYSGLEGRWVIRWRDAHAWVKVFVDGAWRDFDTTPPSFLNLDKLQIPTSFLKDLLSFFGFQMSRLRHETGAGLMETYGLWLILPLGIILWVRLRRTGRIRKSRRADEESVRPAPEKFLETDFFRIEGILRDKGYPRRPYETYGAWLNRVGRHIADPDLRRGLALALYRHNRIRFGQAGVSDDLKKELSDAVSDLLSRLAEVPAA